MSKKLDTIIKLLITVLLATIVVAAVFLIILQIVNYSKTSKIETELVENYDKYSKLIKSLAEIDSVYNNSGITEGYDEQSVIENALRGYVLAHDDKYTRYYSDSEMDSLEDTQSGNGKGLGILIKLAQPNRMIISHVYEDSVLVPYGIQVKDEIIAVNNLDINHYLSTDLVKEIHNADGIIDITFKHNDEIIKASVEKQEYTVNQVWSSTYNDIAILKINEFTYVTANEFISEANKLKSQGYNKFIIDVRDNPGGFVVVVTKILDYLVGNGIIMTTEDKNGNIIEEYKSDANEFDADIVILVNESSASGSELMAQTLKDFNKAKVVGTKTFGKGTVISYNTLRSGGTLVLSTSIYKTHSGYSIEGVGVELDYEVEIPYEYKNDIYE
ncbi:MAG: hypothetical protein IJ593_01530 [Lachnospiraceae bacterium]|nr:hypothetical protein [Lachnospiraceae bacterium]